MAYSYFERALDMNPKDAMAYLGKLLLDLHCLKLEHLEKIDKDISDNYNWKMANKFAQGEVKGICLHYGSIIQENIRKRERRDEEIRKKAEEKKRQEEEKRQNELTIRQAKLKNFWIYCCVLFAIGIVTIIAKYICDNNKNRMEIARELKRENYLYVSRTIEKAEREYRAKGFDYIEAQEKVEKEYGYHTDSLVWKYTEILNDKYRISDIEENWKNFKLIYEEYMEYFYIGITENGEFVYRYIEDISGTRQIFVAKQLYDVKNKLKNKEVIEMIEVHNQNIYLLTNDKEQPVYAISTIEDYEAGAVEAGKDWDNTRRLNQVNML